MEYSRLLDGRNVGSFGYAMLSYNEVKYHSLIFLDFGLNDQFMINLTQNKTRILHDHLTFSLGLSCTINLFPSDNYKCYRLQEF